MAVCPATWPHALRQPCAPLHPELHSTSARQAGVSLHARSEAQQLLALVQSSQAPLKSQPHAKLEQLPFVVHVDNVYAQYCPSGHTGQPDGLHTVRPPVLGRQERPGWQLVVGSHEPPQAPGGAEESSSGGVMEPPSGKLVERLVGAHGVHAATSKLTDATIDSLSTKVGPPKAARGSQLSRCPIFWIGPARSRAGIWRAADTFFPIEAGAQRAAHAYMALLVLQL